jgi:hypothetical protein
MIVGRAILPHFVLSIGLLAGLAGNAPAQVASASILGTVVDESSAVAPGVTVSAREESTGFTRSTVTNSEGGYAIEALLPGRYTVIAVKPGFRATVTEHVQLTVSQKALLDLKLYIGEGRESVTATSTMSPVQTNEASIGYLFDAQTVEELPLDTRNIVALVTLGPGAIPRQLGGFTHDVVNDVQQGSRGSVAFNPPINGSRSTMMAPTIPIATRSPSPFIRRWSRSRSCAYRPHPRPPSFRRRAAAPSTW